MIHEIHEIHEIGAIDTKATGQMLLRRFQHNGGCARALQKSGTEARNRMEKINIELAGIPLELTLGYKNVPR